MADSTTPEETLDSTKAAEIPDSTTVVEMAVIGTPATLVAAVGLGKASIVSDSGTPT